MAFRYDVRFKPTGDLAPLEQWLRDHCAGTFELRLTNAQAEGRSQGGDEVIFRFQRADDRARFRDMLLAVPAP